MGDHADRLGISHIPGSSLWNTVIQDLPYTEDGIVPIPDWGITATPCDIGLWVHEDMDPAEVVGLEMNLDMGEHRVNLGRHTRDELDDASVLVGVLDGWNRERDVKARNYFLVAVEYESQTFKESVIPGFCIHADIVNEEFPESGCSTTLNVLVLLSLVVFVTRPVLCFSCSLPEGLFLFVGEWRLDVGIVDVFARVPDLSGRDVLRDSYVEEGPRVSLKHELLTEHKVVDRDRRI
jgi:hypothetical protein